MTVRHLVARCISRVKGHFVRGMLGVNNNPLCEAGVKSATEG